MLCAGSARTAFLYLPAQVSSACAFHTGRAVPSAACGGIYSSVFEGAADEAD